MESRNDEEVMDLSTFGDDDDDNDDGADYSVV